VIHPPPTVRIYLASHPADMRNWLDGLAAIVASALRPDPLGGHLFDFRNRRGDRLKALQAHGKGVSARQYPPRVSACRFRSARAPLSRSSAAAAREARSTNRPFSIARSASPPRSPHGDPISCTTYDVCR
jgi:transposase